MNLRTCLFSLLLLPAVLLEGAEIKGSGKYIKKEVELGNFRRINAQGNLKVTVRKGDKPSVTVWAEDNIMDYVKAKDLGSTLYLALDEKEFGPRILAYEQIRMEVVAEKFDELRMMGLVELDSPDLFTPYRFELRSSGKCDAKLNVEAEKFEARMSGASSLEVKGEAKKGHFFLSGACEVKGESFKLYEANIEASGTCNASLWVLEYLTGRLSGSTKLKLKGDPESRLRASGMATVE